MRKIKIYGERNTGTIYLEWLLKKNLDVELVDGFEFGWKHRLAPGEEEMTEVMKREVIYLCLIKNPYSWLLSMHKRPYHHEKLRELSFAEFIRVSYGDYRNPVVMWTLKNRSYDNLGKFLDHHMLIKYEDILKDPKKAIEDVTEKFGIEKPGLFRNIHNILTNSHGMTRQTFHTDYYLKERWREKLNQDHITHINKYLDRELMEKLHYSFL